MFPLHYCPYCGSLVIEEEKYCMKCGKELPSDFDERVTSSKSKWKWWKYPIIISLVIALFITVLFVRTQQQENDAQELYQQAEEMALIGDYQTSKEYIEQALDHKNNFPTAKAVLDFLKIAIESKNTINEIDALVKSQNYEEALDKLNAIENNISGFKGDLINKLNTTVSDYRNNILYQQAEHKLTNDLSKDELKELLWDVEEITDDKAEVIKEAIQEKIVAHTSNHATELLKENQFNQAMLVVEDGLIYAEESEQLQSLKTTVEKEKIAFETAQEERIEQALTIYEQEDEINRNQAVEVLNVNASVSTNEITVTGEIKSVATVPINSILVSYQLKNNDTQILENDVYVFPETLYPDEKGKFEFTHFNKEIKNNDLTAEVTKITWFID